MQPIGYYVDPDTALCRNCFTPSALRDENSGEISQANPAAIFSSSEADTPTSCAHCTELIPHTLTEDGKDYVMNAIFEYLVHRRGDLHTIKLWWNEYNDYLTTDDADNLLEDVMEAL